MPVERIVSYDDNINPDPVTIMEGKTHTDSFGLSDEIEENDVNALCYLNITVRCHEELGRIYFKNPLTGRIQARLVYQGPGKMQHTYQIEDPDGRRGEVTWTHYLEKGVRYFATGVDLASYLKSRSKQK